MWGAPRDRARERERARIWKQYRKEEEYWKPTPLELSRRRRLSLPLKPVKISRRSWWNWKKDEVQQQSFDQLQSPLGRLPEELREMIYAHLVAGRRLHVQQTYRRFGYVECASHNSPTETTTCDQVFECLKPHLNKATGVGNYGPSTGSRLNLSSYERLKMRPKTVEGGDDIPCPSNEMLALAETCRLFYTGYISSLYALTVFAFTSLKQFQTFSTTIPLRHLNTIKSLQFSSEVGSSFHDRLDIGWEEVPTSQWKRAWETIANMEKLRFLRVDLRMNEMHRIPETSASGVHKWMEERIFGPMKEVGQTSIFEVSVNWNESRGFVLGETSFTLARKWERVAWSVGAARH
jgi:hypothetical protein